MKKNIRQSANGKGESLKKKSVSLRMLLLRRTVLCIRDREAILRHLVIYMYPGSRAFILRHTVLHAYPRPRAFILRQPVLHINLRPRHLVIDRYPRQRAFLRHPVLHRFFFIHPVLHMYPRPRSFILIHPVLNKKKAHISEI